MPDDGLNPKVRSRAQMVAHAGKLAERYLETARKAQMHADMAMEAEKRAQDHRKIAGDLWGTLDEIAKELRAALGGQGGGPDA